MPIWPHVPKKSAESEIKPTETEYEKNSILIQKSRDFCPKSFIRRNSKWFKTVHEEPLGHVSEPLKKADAENMFIWKSRNAIFISKVWRIDI